MGWTLNEVRKPACYRTLLGMRWCLSEIVPLGYCATKIRNESLFSCVFSAFFLMSKTAEDSKTTAVKSAKGEIGRGRKSLNELLEDSLMQ